LQIGKILDNRKKNDQEKVKDYINVLHRYINVSDKIPVAIGDSDEQQQNINTDTPQFSPFGSTPASL